MHELGLAHGGEPPRVAAPAARRQIAPVRQEGPSGEVDHAQAVLAPEVEQASLVGDDDVGEMGKEGVRHRRRVRPHVRAAV
jgi:hypothetical protein